MISIHAPLAGSDGSGSVRLPMLKDFNPRSPCGERRIFGGGGNGAGDFNPRSPCGERLVVDNLNAEDGYISIHAPLAGSDRRRPGRSPGPDISIHAPLAGSDDSMPQSPTITLISIHAPLAGSDVVNVDVIHKLVISIHAPLAGSDDVI